MRPRGLLPSRIILNATEIMGVDPLSGMLIYMHQISCLLQNKFGWYYYKNFCWLKSLTDIKVAEKKNMRKEAKFRIFLAFCNDGEK